LIFAFFFSQQDRSGQLKPKVRTVRFCSDKFKDHRLVPERTAGRSDQSAQSLFFTFAPFSKIHSNKSWSMIIIFCIFLHSFAAAEERCGKPVLDLPRCSDGRLRTPVCPADDSPTWQVTNDCFGDGVRWRIEENPKNKARKPVLAIALTGMLRRVELLSKAAHLLTNQTLEHFQ
jgi:hypothetical protein